MALFSNRKQNENQAADLCADALQNQTIENILAAKTSIDSVSNGALCDTCPDRGTEKCEFYNGSEAEVIETVVYGCIPHFFQEFS